MISKELLAHLKDHLLDDLEPKFDRELKRHFRARLDGHWEHRTPIRFAWATQWGAWRTWFTSHRVHTGAISVLGQKGSGCMPHFVWTYQRIYHFGPLKVIFGAPSELLTTVERLKGQAAWDSLMETPSVASKGGEQ